MGLVVLEKTAGTLRMTAREFAERWCIFHHIANPADGPFYAGICKIRDLYDFTEPYKNSYWRRHVTEDTVLTITLMATCETQNDAMKGLRDYCAIARPIANSQGFKINGQMVVTCIEGEKAGQTYASSSEAALKNGISKGAMSNHLNRRPGYETIHGMIFKKGFI